MPEILAVKRLSKSFGKVRAVSDLSFQVESREILGIIEELHEMVGDGSEE